jgi:hypothetical protein
MDYDPDKEAQLRFYDEIDLRAVANNSYRWGMFAGAVSMLVILASIVYIGWLFDL